MNQIQEYPPPPFSLDPFPESALPHVEETQDGRLQLGHLRESDEERRAIIKCQNIAEKYLVDKQEEE